MLRFCAVAGRTVPRGSHCPRSAPRERSHGHGARMRVTTSPRASRPIGVRCERSLRVPVAHHVAGRRIHRESPSYFFRHAIADRAMRQEPGLQYSASKLEFFVADLGARLARRDAGEHGSRFEHSFESRCNCEHCNRALHRTDTEIVAPRTRKLAKSQTTSRTIPNETSYLHVCIFVDIREVPRRSSAVPGITGLSGRVRGRSFQVLSQHSFSDLARSSAWQLR